MWPSPQRPALGAFVEVQVEALRRIPGVEVDVFAFPPGGYLKAARDLRRRGSDHDVVHAHFGLTAFPTLVLRGVPRTVTLHGMDVQHPRSRRLTQLVLPFCDLVAAASQELAAQVPTRKPIAILPIGVDLHRFRPIDRLQARAKLGLEPDGRYVLLPHDPSRPFKRADRARELAEACGAQLLTLGAVAPDEVPLHHNAANAVLVPSQVEGFGLAVLEALACDVPVLATPVGNHPAALDGVPGTLCADYDLGVWQAALEPHLTATDPRIEGRAQAARWSADAMAARVVEAWRGLLEPRAGARQGVGGSR